jgi:ADP-ribosylglycohydrolase
VRQESVEDTMADITINRNEYRDKVLACWLGKNIGGTLGAPFEWKRQVNNVTFYTQELGGEPLPNDDLDIQLLWLIALEERGIEVDAKTLADYWCWYVTPHWSEYGNAKINMRRGLVPPICGSAFNDHKDSCGSFIRTEIWACIAPGLPRLAAQYAYQDAILDHGDGEGTYASIFIAAMESAAFVHSDLRQLIDIGLSYIPAECGVARAVHTTLQAFDRGLTWKEARDEILRHHRGRFKASDPADRQKGFETGALGYDVPSNIGITILGLLYGGDDFGKMICTTVNCGEDTDCTGATAGSIFGIMHGTKAIPQKWIDPIGRGIKTVAINVGDLGARVARDVDDLTDRTEHIAMQVLARGRGRPVVVRENAATNIAAATVEGLKANDQGASLYHHAGPIYKFDFFEVAVDYCGSPLIRSGEPKTVRIAIRNTYGLQANLTLHWYLPDGWEVAPARDGSLMSLRGNLYKPAEVEFTFTAAKVDRPLNRAVLEITIEGRPTVMLVPIQLLNGNYGQPIQVPQQEA